MTGWSPRRLRGLVYAAWSEARRRGLSAPVRRAWRRYGYGRDEFVVFTGPLAGPPPDLPPDGIAIRHATDDDLAALGSLPPAESRRIRTLMAESDGWLHVAREGDRVVGYRWMARCIHGVLARAVPLDRDQVYAAYTFVHPEHRRLNIALRLVRSQNQRLAALGFRHYVAAARSTNVASIRLTVRRGGVPVQFVRSRRLLFFHRTRVWTTIPPDVQRLIDTPRETPDT